MPKLSPLATISFQAEAHDSAAAFFNLLTPHHRPALAVGEHYIPVNNDSLGYCVTVVPYEGEPFDAEVRDVSIKSTTGQYTLVVWEWPDEADRGDPSKERVLDLYDDIDRVEVI